MSKVTEKAAQALRDQRKMVSGNTRVEFDNVTARMFLHGNFIAGYCKELNRLIIRDAGWKTVTTKDRLNGILETFGSKMYIRQHDYKWYLVDSMGRETGWKGSLELTT